jgi:hypothetical protein
MKKKFTLLLFALLGGSFQIWAQFISVGNNTVYTFESLSTITNSGVTKEGNTYSIVNDITIKPTDTLKVDNNATVKLANGITIYVEGQANFAPADTAVFTRLDENAAPKGIYFRGDSADVALANITFEYGGVRYTKESSINVTNCTFRNINKGLGTYALGLGKNTAHITRCNFISNLGPALNLGANVVTNLTFDHNYLYDNNTDNTNAPQLNLSCPGDAETIVTNNTLIGTGRDRVGAIAVSNLLGMAGSHKAVIDSNYMIKHRYGITINGGVNTFIRYNQIIDNKYETNPNNGGSGISLYSCPKAVVTGNLIEGNLWGITVVSGTGDINLGKTADPNAEDYNPGLNVFKDNENSGTLYDLYNNTVNTVYAQGNTWNVEVQDSVSIETVIFHKADDGTLGEVIFLPPAQKVLIPQVSKESTVFFDSTTKSLVLNSAYSRIAIFSSNGKQIFDTRTQQATVNLPNLTKGIYFARITSGSTVSVVKFIY